MAGPPISPPRRRALLSTDKIAVDRRCSLRPANYARVIEDGKIWRGARKTGGQNGWVQELVAAPDLETIGGVIHQRLTAYTAVGAPQSERALAERRSLRASGAPLHGARQRARLRLCATFEFFASRWVDFVNQNKAAEDELDRLGRQEQYERGRAEATIAVAKGGCPAPAAATLPVVAAAPATAPVSLSDAVHQTINVLVAAEVAKQVAKAPTPTGAAAGGRPADPPAAPAAGTEGLRLSQALALYLAPPGKKRRHKTKGRRDTAAVVQFAVDFFGDPVFDSITMADWDRLDEAMTDIPHTKGLPGDCRVPVCALPVRAGSRLEGSDPCDHHHRRETLPLRPRQIPQVGGQGRALSARAAKVQCIDEDNKTPLPRDAFDNKELIALISSRCSPAAPVSIAFGRRASTFVQSHIYWGYLDHDVDRHAAGRSRPARCAPTS